MGNLDVRTHHVKWKGWGHEYGRGWGTPRVFYSVLFQYILLPILHFSGGPISFRVSFLARYASNWVPLQLICWASVVFRAFG